MMSWNLSYHLSQKKNIGETIVHSFPNLEFWLWKGRMNIVLNNYFMFMLNISIHSILVLETLSRNHRLIAFCPTPECSWVGSMSLSELILESSNDSFENCTELAPDRNENLWERIMETYLNQWLIKTNMTRKMNHEKKSLIILIWSVRYVIWHTGINCSLKSACPETRSKGESKCQSFPVSIQSLANDPQFLT
jgi:hypothetical protein